MPANRPPSLYDIIYIYTHPDLIFWYLPALMWIYITVIPVELSGLLKHFKSGALCIAASSCVLWLAHPAGGPNSPWLLATAGALQLLPFFLMGCWFYRFQSTLTGGYLKYLALLNLAVVFITLFNQIPQLDRSDLSATLLSASFLWAMFQFRIRQQLLIFIGKYSLSIFLYHMLAVPATRIVVRKLPITVDLQILLMLLAGIVGPIIIEKAAIRAIIWCKRIKPGIVPDTIKLLIGKSANTAAYAPNTAG